MKTNDFDFNLPKELIAQTPLASRTSSKLLVVNKDSGAISHTNFKEITNYFKRGDVLVLNETKVIPARIFGFKDTGAKIEVLLLKALNDFEYETLVRPARKVKVGETITFSNELKAVCLEEKDDGIRIFKLIYDGVLIEILERLGEMPLPPYITEKLDDKDRYQTVYAKNLGSAAAPTAGLHFTDELLKELETKGVEILRVTLHVGLGTFRPVSVTNVLEHKMHSEAYEITEEVADQLNKAYFNKNKIIAVGTTVIRTLESNFDNMFHAGKFDTNIFIYPGYQFKVVDELITNFHLPKSTLLMLVSAFSSKELMLKAYHEAINYKYRFFSFGDAMFIRKGQ